MRCSQSVPPPSLSLRALTTSRTLELPHLFFSNTNDMNPAASTSPILSGIAALCFGLVIGWTAHYILIRTKKLSIASIGSFIAAIGGSAVVALFSQPTSLALYFIGLFLAFFSRVIAGSRIGAAIGDEAAKAAKDASKDEPPTVAYPGAAGR